MAIDIPVAGTSIDPGLFSGKRRAHRTRRTLVVHCVGPGGLVAEGRTVDVSKGGMLLEMTDSHFLAPRDPSLLVAFATRLASAFPEGMHAVFSDGAVRVHATIVRLVTSSTGTAPILLGCRFDPHLAEVDCALLGLDAEGDETSTPKLEASAASPGTSFPSGDCAGSEPDELLEFIQGSGDSGDSWVDGGRKALDTWSEHCETKDAAAAAAAAIAASSTKRAGSEGLDDENLRRISARGSLSSSSSQTPSSQTPCPEPTDTGVVAYVFPVAVPFLGPHYRGRVVVLQTRAVVVDMLAPAGEVDVVGWAAGIGVESRIVCLREGRVLWETRAKVARLDRAGPGEARAVLVPEREPSESVREALGVAGAA